MGLYKCILLPCLYRKSFHLLRFVFLFLVLISGGVLPGRVSFSAQEPTLEMRLFQDEEHHLTSPYGCVVSVQESESGTDKDESSAYADSLVRLKESIGLYFFVSGKISGPRVLGLRLHLIHLVFRN